MTFKKRGRNGGAFDHPGRRRAGSADPADANSRLAIPHSCARKIRAKPPGRYVENRAHGHAERLELHFGFG